MSLNDKEKIDMNERSKGFAKIVERSVQRE